MMKRKKVNNMEDKPKISVILPAYNAEKYVAKTLESLLTQTLKEVEFGVQSSIHKVFF